jgi:hypothetical protein
MSQKGEVFIPAQQLIKKVQDVISPDGGSYTIDALVHKLDSINGFSDGLSLTSKRNLVRRALELLEAIRTGKSIEVFIGVDTVTGELLSPHPAGVKPVGDVVIFEPY